MEILGERPAWAMSDSEKLSTLDAVRAERARLKVLELELIAELDRAEYARQLGAADTARLLAERYRLDLPAARRIVRMANALTKHPATAAAMPDSSTPCPNPSTARPATHTPIRDSSATPDPDDTAPPVMDGDDSPAAGADEDGAETSGLMDNADGENGSEGAHGSDGAEGAESTNGRDTQESDDTSGWRVHPAQAEVIMSFLDHLPTTVPVENVEFAERKLIELAASHTPSELRAAGKRIRDLLDPDGPEPDEKQAYARESLTWKNAAQGLTFRGYLACENAELFRTLIRASARPHKTVTGELDPRPHSKRQADALTTILNAASTPMTHPATTPAATDQTRDPNQHPSARRNSRLNAIHDQHPNQPSRVPRGSHADANGPRPNQPSRTSWGSHGDRDLHPEGDSILHRDSHARRAPGVDEEPCADRDSCAHRDSCADRGLFPDSGMPDRDVGLDLRVPDRGVLPGLEPLPDRGGAHVGGTRSQDPCSDRAANLGVAPRADAGAGASAAAEAGAGLAGGANVAAGAGTATGESAGPVIGHGAKAHISVTIDFNDLKGAVAGATGELMSGDTLSAATIRRLACDAEILPIVLGSKSQPLDVGTSQRLVTRPMRRALNARDKGCVVCNAPPVECEAHHLHHWIDGGITAVNNLVLLCKRDHLDLHSGNWRIRIIDGVVEVDRPTWADTTRIPPDKYRSPVIRLATPPTTQTPPDPWADIPA